MRSIRRKLSDAQKNQKDFKSKLNNIRTIKKSVTMS